MTHIFPSDNIHEAFVNFYCDPVGTFIGIPWRHRRDAENASINETALIYRIHVIPRRKGNGKE